MTKNATFPSVLNKKTSNQAKRDPVKQRNKDHLGAEPLADDLALWQEVSQGITPLESRDRFAFGRPLPAPVSGSRSLQKQPPAQPHAQPHAPILKPVQRSQSAPCKTSLKTMDHRKAERFRKGLLPLEAVLDLHGMTQPQAHAALDRYIADCFARGLRAVLVITGKGNTGEGVLKARVPDWLHMSPNSDWVLAFTPARLHHGGTGALYVLLRRDREQNRGGRIQQRPRVTHKPQNRKRCGG